MKKSLLLLILLSMAVAASACNAPDVTGSTTGNSSANQETGSNETVVKEANTPKETTGNKASDELVSIEPTETIGAQIQNNQPDTAQSSDSSNDDSQSAPEETAYPGPDTATLVNLRGDTTTVYKLANECKKRG